MKNETTASEKSKILMRTYITSLLSLMLCVTMLLGTTYAWFTSEVTTSGNEIQVGTLLVDLTDEAGKTLKGQSGLFGSGTVKWEPGATQIETVNVVNKGDLAFNYSLYLSTIAADVSDLALVGQYIDVYITTDNAEAACAQDLKDKWIHVGTLADTARNGYVLANGSWIPEQETKNGVLDTVKIALHMPSEVSDSEVMGKKITNLGIKLIAVQKVAEEDTFGPEYDKDAVYADASYVAGGKAGLASVLKDINAAEDETVIIHLNDDVEWVTGSDHGSTPWIEKDAAVQNLIVDGKGNTITATGNGVGPIRMANGGTLTIKNAKIVDNSVSYAESSWEFTYLEFQGKLVFQNCEFTSGIMMEGESAEFVDCTFYSGADSEYSVWVTNGDASFNRCSFSGTRALKTHEAYSTDVGTILVDSCTFDNITKKPGMAIGTVDADTTITIKNSDFINCQAGEQGKYIYETDTDVTTFKFDVSQNNEVIKSVTPDLVIKTADELFAFAKSVNEDGNSYAGKLVVLGANIDLKNDEWTPVGQTGGNGAANYFQGMFDGKGYTISNLRVSQNNTYLAGNYASGLFGFIDAADAQIVNVNVDGASVTGTHWTGVIAGYLTGKISGCTVTNATVVCNHANSEACGDKAGVITGYVNSGVVTGNTVKNCTVTAGRDAGQVSGTSKTEYTYGNTIYNVTVTATGDCTGANIRNEEIGRLN